MEVTSMVGLFQTFALVMKSSYTGLYRKAIRKNNLNLDEKVPRTVERASKIVVLFRSRWFCHRAYCHTKTLLY